MLSLGLHSLYKLGSWRQEWVVAELGFEPELLSFKARIITLFANWCCLATPQVLWLQQGTQLEDSNTVG